MESKVSEGGLNVTLTIRLLMHGKVQKHRQLPLPLSLEGECQSHGCPVVNSLVCTPQTGASSPTVTVGISDQGPLGL